MNEQGTPVAGAELEEWVVVAEDSAPNRQILVLLLKKMQYRVIECEDGAAAWKAIEESATKNIVAIVSDLMMPQMDGLELLKKVRATERIKSTPFVLVTAVSDKDYIFEAKGAGVNGYILKPVTFKRVLAKFQELFPNRKFPGSVAA
jgi:two-component system chemotaxis response regulator CheY